MNNIDTTGVVILLLALALVLWILYNIIKFAISSALREENKKQDKFLSQQVRLLSELLKQSGVNEQRINDILDFSKPYFLSKSEQSKS